MKRIHIERKIAHLQKVLSRHYPTHTMPPIIYIERDTEGNLIIPTTGEIEHNGVHTGSEALNFETQCAELELTDIPEDELKQRDEDEQKLKDTLQQIELDKLMKRKPRVKK